MAAEIEVKGFIHIDELKPHPNNDKLLPIPSDVDLQRLKERIKKYGFTEDVEITKEKVILDGHNRVNILRKYADELKIEQVPYRVIDITEEEENAYIISKNLDRRQLTQLMQSYIRGKYYNEVKKKIGSNQYTQNLPEGDPEKYLKTSEIVAKKYGASASTIEKDGRFVYKCNELIMQTSYEFVYDLLNGKIDANKNIIVKFSEMPENVIHKIYKHYQSSNETNDSLAYAIYKFGDKTNTKERAYFNVGVNKEHYPKLAELAKTKENNWHKMMDEIVEFYFEKHKKK